MTLYVSKVATFRQQGAMPRSTFVQGLIVGASLMIGTWGGKLVVRRISAHAFRLLLDAVMLVSGCALIWSGVRG